MSKGASLALFFGKGFRITKRLPKIPNSNFDSAFKKSIIGQLQGLPDDAKGEMILILRTCQAGFPCS
ncbi:MAG: hypothetical protein II615_05630 [Ruminococcus sp.]|jgi:hypothetical protein|nr:hypothetical protein [Ruminococcus sp.]